MCQSSPSNKQLLQKTRSTAATHREATAILNQLDVVLIHYCNKVTGENGIFFLFQKHCITGKGRECPSTLQVLQLAETENARTEK